MPLPFIEIPDEETELSYSELTKDSVTISIE